MAMSVLYLEVKVEVDVEEVPCLLAADMLLSFFCFLLFVIWLVMPNFGADACFIVGIA